MGTPAIALLVRHAHSEKTDAILCGRTPGIHLSDRGRQELSRLRECLLSISLRAVYSSPLVRARETAEAIASDHGVGVDVDEDLNEFDFGEWTGEAFTALSGDPRWRAFNERRSTARVPNGDRPADVQRRIVALLQRVTADAEGGTIVLVSHAELIRSAVLWFNGRSLDEFHQVTIDTASVTGILMSPAPRVMFVNATDPASVARSVQQLEPARL